MINTAIRRGLWGPAASLMAQPAAAEQIAASHSFDTYDDASPVFPILRFRVRLNIRNSTQPAMPAEAVRPAAPHLRSIPISLGNGIANRKPSAEVRRTRTIA